MLVLNLSFIYNNNKHQDPIMKMNRLAQRPILIIVLITLITVMTGLWIAGSRSSYILCSADCGEIFDALQYVNNYNLYGFKYRLIQDMATSPELESHPYFYTHNANLAGYFFVFLEIVGVKSLWAKQLFTLAIFALGLFYVFRTVSIYTSSRMAGLITLLFFCSDYEHVLVFGLNSLRAWHWLALFGITFHSKKILSSLGKKAPTPFLDYFFFACFAIVSFCLGYDFWVICIFIVLLLFYFFLERPLVSKKNLSIVLLVGLIFLMPFILRQIQIISGLGLDFWAKDFYYSAAIKVSFLNRIFPITSMEQVDEFYRQFNVQRPPAFQSQSLSQNLRTLKDMLIHITIPTYGSISVLLGAILCISSVVLGFSLTLNSDKEPGLNDRLARLKLSDFEFTNSSKFLASVFLGIALGLGFFAPLSFHIYLKHQFPLIAVLFILPKAFIVTIAIEWLFKWYRFAIQKGLRLVAVTGIIIALIGDHIWIQYDNYLAKEPIDVSWIDTVADMPGQTFAVSWIPGSVSVFTNTWAVGVGRGRERDALDRLNQGIEPFQIEDYFLFGERDAESNPTKYLRPSFWLYFPTEQLSSFDNPVPICRQDYLVKFIRRVFSLSTPKTIPLTGLIPQASVRPGGQLFISGKIEGEKSGIEHIYVLHDGEVLGELLYNCLYNQYVGIVQIPEEAGIGKYKISVRADYVDGRQFIVSRTRIDISDIASSDYTLPQLNSSQLSIEQVISKYPNIKVYKKDSNFIILDLRQQ